MDVKASILSELDVPWHTETVEIDDPHPYEVRVKVAFSGLCHSDRHLQTGSLAQSPDALAMISGRPTMFPIIGGHEGSGVVDAVGDGVTSVKPGDHVATSFIPSCGKCEYCISGRPYICDMAAGTLAGPMISDGTWRHHLGDTNVNRMCNLGTFAEYIVAHEASVIRVEPWYDLRAAALLSCGISTGFGGAATRGGGQPGDAVAASGCGGLGSAAIQGALHAGARAVLAIDTNQSKIDRAMKIGATHGSTTTLEAAFTILPDLTWGKNCDVVIITVGEATSEIIEQARSILAKGGVIVAAGLAAWDQTSVELNLFMFSMMNQELRGTVLGCEAPRLQVAGLLRLQNEGKFMIDDLVTREYSLDEVQKGYDDLKAGENIRGVIRF